MLIKGNLQKTHTLYNAFLDDILTSLINNNFTLFYSFQSDYQDIFSSLKLIAPELNIMFDSFINSYFLQKTLHVNPVALFDSFNNNLNFYSSEGTIYFLLFTLYA
jgi:hypothetical protein